MNEVWKPITGYELMYSVSNLGNIRNETTGLNLKPWKNWKGYLLVDLYSNGKATHKSVHRLVAEAFLGSKHGMQVNHKNEVKSDNRLGNLEWVTQKENINYGTGNYRKGMAKRVKVVSRSLSGEEREYNGIVEASASTGAEKSNISAACRGKRKTAGGLYWNYKE